MQIQFDGEPTNPKLLKLQDILQVKLVNDANARGIIFVKSRELAQAVVRWINESPDFQNLQASEFVGQGAKASCGGKQIVFILCLKTELVLVIRLPLFVIFIHTYFDRTKI